MTVGRLYGNASENKLTVTYVSDRELFTPPLYASNEYALDM